jgi:RNA polymerase sigma-70 factor (ECF subfamily)
MAAIVTGAPVFATTQWGIVVESADKNSPNADAALAELCRTYWQPAYAFVRRAGYTSADAEDLTQEFFAYILGRNWLAQANPARGRFRAFLLTSLKNFLRDAGSRARSQKRGGTYSFVSLDAHDAEAHYSQMAAEALAPEATFDAAWARSEVEQTLISLRERYAAEGKRELFDTLRPFIAGGSDRSYEDVAASLGCSLAAVKTHIHRLRQRYAELLRAQIERTVIDPAEVNSELRYLCSVL